MGAISANGGTSVPVWAAFSSIRIAVPLYSSTRLFSRSIGSGHRSAVGWWKCTEEEGKVDLFLVVSSTYDFFVVKHIQHEVKDAEFVTFPQALKVKTLGLAWIRNTTEHIDNTLLVMLTVSLFWGDVESLGCGDDQMKTSIALQATPHFCHIIDSLKEDACVISETVWVDNYFDIE